MAEFVEVDLHGCAVDAGRVGYLLRMGVERAQRRRAGLRIIHGRGQHVMADLVQEILRQQRLEFVEGFANPGETRVDAHDLLRHRWR